MPRKLKKQIPKNTHYCYTPTSETGIMDNGKWGYTIKLCPFYIYIYIWRKIKDVKPDYLDDEDILKFGENNIGWCKLVKGEIDDQCKNCGTNY